MQLFFMGQGYLSGGIRITASCSEDINFPGCSNTKYIHMGAGGVIDQLRNGRYRYTWGNRSCIYAQALQVFRFYVASGTKAFQCRVKRRFRLCNDRAGFFDPS